MLQDLEYLKDIVKRKEILTYEIGIIKDIPIVKDFFLSVVSSGYDLYFLRFEDEKKEIHEGFLQCFT